ncbi:hypothetical protein PRIPAC_81803, partial [Pristionchus pacificus]|uniref:G protein-coupled receptor n=1 Tax=Pristionchus pacificus TaxID=54126 RepID=A0A2A6CPX4_PRIPA
MANGSFATAQRNQEDPPLLHDCLPAPSSASPLHSIPVRKQSIAKIFRPARDDYCNILFPSERLPEKIYFGFFIFWILGLISDVVLNIILDPLMLLPELCMLREFPMIPIPGSPYLYYELWVRLITMNTLIFGACFLERHQTARIQSDQESSVLEVSLYYRISDHSKCALGSNCAVADSICFTNTMLRSIRFHQFRRYVYRRTATVHCRDGCSESFDYTFPLNDDISFHTFSSLRKTTTLSEAFTRNNRAFNKALVVQASSPLSLIVFPLIYSLSAVMLDAEGPLPFSLCYMMHSLHSPVHSVLLLTFVRMYRDKACEMFRK